MNMTKTRFPASSLIVSATICIYLMSLMNDVVSGFHVQKQFLFRTRKSGFHVSFGKSPMGSDSDDVVSDFVEFIESRQNANVETDKRTYSENTKEDKESIPPVSPNQAMKAMKTSPRRIAISLITSSMIALGTNFLGGTSTILSSLPEDTVERSGLDTYYPRGDYKRYRGYDYKYSFIIPKDWVADQAILVAKTQSRAGILDYSKAQSQRASRTLPDAAFGPVGRFNERGISQSDENVSVIASKLPVSGFTLDKLGSPERAAEKLFALALAPEGSGRQASLIEACKEFRGD